MKPAPIPATPDLMTLVRLIGGAMLAAWVGGVCLPLLVIGVMCPRFGMLIEIWLRAEERVAAGAASDEVWGDDDGAGASTSGWLSREGPVWRWRQVTRFGSRLVIPVVLFAACDDPASLGWGRVWMPAWSLALPRVARFFRDGAAPG